MVVVVVVDTWGDHVGDVAEGGFGVQGRVGVAAVAREGSAGAETPLGSMQRQTCGRTPTAVVEWGVGCVRVGFETWGVAFAVGRGAAAAGAVGAHITESISSTESLLPECSEDGAARRGTVLIAGVAGWRTVSCGSGR